MAFWALLYVDRELNTGETTRAPMSVKSISPMVLREIGRNLLVKSSKKRCPVEPKAPSIFSAKLDSWRNQLSIKSDTQIGRASCRERGKRSAVRVAPIR